MPFSSSTARSMKRTKIVATIGPASQSPETIKRLALAGADVFRLNFSHGTHEFHLTTLRMVRDVAREIGCPLACLGDLSGPKLRLRDVVGDAVRLEDNDEIILTSADDANGANKRFGVNFKDFHQVAKTGERIMLDDGKFVIVVEGIRGKDVHCRTMNGGLLKSRKGVNLPDTKLPIPALTEKDRKDMEFALGNGIDVLALSFVRSKDDITIAKYTMESFGRVVPLFAKIEKKEAVENLDAIIRAADGAMVARGDLGIEIPIQQIPAVQKRLIALCNKLARPVITATQMLESMITSPTPTRAEVTDIYNAILDGTDAVMLSAETAAGEYPVQAVEVMDSVAEEAERAISWNKDLAWMADEVEKISTTHVICNSAVRVAEELNLDLIIVPTHTGYTARHVSRFKPRVPVFACSESEEHVNPMCLTWGVTARRMEPIDAEAREKSPSDALIDAAVACAKQAGVARSGNRAVVIGGLPLGVSRHTNFLRVVEVK